MKEKINIGKMIYERIDFSNAFRSEPKKEYDDYIGCPEMKVREPLSEEFYRYEVIVYAERFNRLKSLLDEMIDIGKPGIEGYNWRLSLHAVAYKKERVRGKKQFKASLMYVFKPEKIENEII